MKLPTISTLDSDVNRWPYKALGDVPVGPEVTSSVTKRKAAMSGQIYKPVFGVTAKEKQLTVTSAHPGPMDQTTRALNLLTQTARSIGDLAYALLMITVVGAHPVWVALLIAFVYSN